MHSKEVHIEADKCSECSEDVEKENQKYPSYSVAFESVEVPIELRDVCSWQVRLRLVEAE